VQQTTFEKANVLPIGSDQAYVTEDKPMAIRSRVEQDRRGISRVVTRLDCQITFDGVSRDAVIVDLSLRGAFLSSSFLPPKDGAVTITLKSPISKKVLKLEGKVVRGGWGMSDHGQLSRFGVRFSHAPLDLAEIIRKLNM
jgi:hypothetical protein